MDWFFDLVHLLVIFGVLTGYGVMSGVTIQVARGAGVKPGSDIALGLAWPFGLGMAIAYGFTRPASLNEEDRRRARAVQTQEQREAERERRQDEMREQEHNTKIAELKARETMALERTLHPTFESKGLPS